MNPVDLTFAGVLTVSFLLGPLLARSRLTRQYGSALVGIGMVLVLTGYDAVHSLATLVGYCFLKSSFPARFLPHGAVVWCFGYLTFVRTCHWFGYPKVGPLTNALQLLFTLRLIGLAFELHDSWYTSQQLSAATKQRSAQRNSSNSSSATSPDVGRHRHHHHHHHHNRHHQEEEEKEANHTQPPTSNVEPVVDAVHLGQLRLQHKYKSVKATLVDVTTYAYCYTGLFTGPYFKYRTYIDWVNQLVKCPPSRAEQLVQQLLEALLCTVAYVITSHFYSVDEVRQPAFYANHSIAYRFYFMMAIFTIMRLRFYSAWKAAECVFMSAGLGVYPAVSKPSTGEGPTDLQALDNWMSMQPSMNAAVASASAAENSSRSWGDGVVQSPPLPSSSERLECDNAYNYTTITNLSIWQCEFAPTLRQSMRAWNQTVQYWLSANFYRRCPGSRFVRSSYTMLISAYWHGIHAGYYLSFLTIPLGLAAETALASLFDRFNYPEHVSRPSSSSSPLQTFVTWLIRMRLLEYLGMAFLLLDARTTLRYWQSLGFCLHGLLLSLIVLNWIVELVWRRRRSRPNYRVAEEEEEE